MQHPDEGTIHAWLDGALPPEEGRAIEAHAAECAACAAAIAEARGLIAASSRILAALDAVPGGVLPSADAFETSGSERMAPSLRRGWWRSVPLRAAAAIVLVGSVSWLATRSRVQHEPKAATDAVMAPAEDRMRVAEVGPSPERASPKKVTAAGTIPDTAAPAPRGYEAPRPAPPPAPVVPNAQPRQEAANVVAQSSAAFGSSAGSAGAVNRVAPPPSVESGSATVGSIAARTAKSSGGAGVPDARRDVAAKAMAAERDSSAVRRASDEQRLVASPMARAQMPMAAMSAPAAESLMPGRAALQRLLGCYSLELPSQSAADRAARPAESLLPKRIELHAERADGSDAAAMLLRPAQGEPALPSTVSASWKTVGEHALELTITDGARTLTASLTIAGDSVTGWARTSTGGKEEGVSMLRGRRSSCTGP